MRIVTALAAALVFVPLRLVPTAQAPGADRYWPQWRGPAANGISRTANPPAEWGEKKNIRWKVEIPGRGSSSPIVWGDRVFILTAIPASASLPDSHRPLGGVSPRGAHRYVVMALDRRDGRVVWERTAREEAPHEASHQDNGTWASSSALTDGELVIAPFESRGIYAYDMNGTLVWEKDLGDKSMRNEFGEGSTPVLYKNTLVVVWDHTKGSFITALDKRTGRELWRASREEIDTWATPLVLEVNGRPQVIVPGMRRIRGYDLANGAVIWEGDGLTMNPIPSPVHADGLVFLMSGFQGNDLKAIRIADARGNIDGSIAIAWTLDRDTPYVPSPVAGTIIALGGEIGQGAQRILEKSRLDHDGRIARDVAPELPDRERASPGGQERCVDRPGRRARHHDGAFGEGAVLEQSLEHAHLKRPPRASAGEHQPPPPPHPPFS